MLLLAAQVCGTGWAGGTERVSGHLGKERRGAQQLQVVMQARNLNFI